MQNTKPQSNLENTSPSITNNIFGQQTPTVLTVQLSSDL